MATTQAAVGTKHSDATTDHEEASDGETCNRFDGFSHMLTSFNSN